ncbi:MOSC domain-containing protein [uncultured Martelella sp.]|uniref:MOSC domain-containing protein n=1 Tax=uncultured Martelella sp. TaxID=392331 RepID=UPI0029C97745|nr:MOSC domain-containing protein [uncultured Martelella sp.]
MKIRDVCIGETATLDGVRHRTGIFKRPVAGPVQVGPEGFDGDHIGDRRNHGGIDQAVYIEGSVSLDWWEDELGVPYQSGMFGENLVVEGLDNRMVLVGDRFVIGDVVLEVTSCRIPCNTFARRMEDPKFVRRYRQAARPGVYCRVIASGTIAAGQAIDYHRFEGTRVPLPEMMENYGRKLSPQDKARYLAAPVHWKLRKELERQAD